MITIRPEKPDDITAVGLINETAFGQLAEARIVDAIRAECFEYYPRFGFVPALRYGPSCQWDGVPDEAFMVLILDEKVMASVSGTVRYPASLTKQCESRTKASGRRQYHTELMQG